MCSLIIDYIGDYVSLVLYRKLAPRPILLKIQTGHGSLYRLFFFSMFRNFNTLKRGNATDAPIQEMSAGVFGPVCRRVRITTELCLARTSSKCFYRLAILVSRALSAATLHETCATAAQKDTTLTLRSKTQCDLFSALFRGSSWVIYLSRPRLRNVHRWLPTSEITSTRPPYPATVAI